MSQLVLQWLPKIQSIKLLSLQDNFNCSFYQFLKSHYLKDKDRTYINRETLNFRGSGYLCQNVHNF